MDVPTATGSFGVGITVGVGARVAVGTALGAEVGRKTVGVGADSFTEEPQAYRPNTARAIVKNKETRFMDGLLKSYLVQSIESGSVFLSILAPFEITLTNSTYIIHIMDSFSIGR
jgi:hypothetical protein